MCHENEKSDKRSDSNGHIFDIFARSSKLSKNLRPSYDPSMTITYSLIIPTIIVIVNNIIVLLWLKNQVTWRSSDTSSFVPHRKFCQ